MRLRKISIFLFSVFLFGFTLMAGHSAEAHFLSVITGSSSSKVGDPHTVNLSFTHVLPFTAQFGAEFTYIYATNIAFNAKYVYNDGTETAFSSFSPGQTMNSATAQLEKEGTVLLSARCSMTMFGGDADNTNDIPVKAFSKQILNASEDGWSKHTVGEEMEIVPQSDIADAKVGETIKFKVILNSAPLVGATIEWADPASELYEDPIEGGDSNLQNLPDPTGSDGIFSYTITHAGLNALAIAHEDSGTNYACSFIFDAKDADDDGGSDGGCNAGFGVLSLAGLPMFLVSSLRKKRG
jgi:Synergist-CTERM protein sorting domain-containing protein